MQAHVSAYPARKPRLPWLKRLVVSLDALLRRHHAVIEYTCDPRCVLRLNIDRLDRDIRLADGTQGRAGDRIINLHLWNEQVPVMPRQGASMGWARQMHSALRRSLCELARYAAQRADLGDVAVVRCIVAIAGPTQGTQIVRLMGGFGFETSGMPRPPTLRERALRLGENILITLMVLAHNAPALRRDTLRRGRTEIFMSRAVLERRYGAAVP